MPSFPNRSPRADPAPKRSGHRWLLILLLPGLVIAAALGLRALLHPVRISAFLLHQTQMSTGLELTLERPADVGLWPDLHIQLTGLVAREPGAARPLLRAARVEAALPWSMLGRQDLRLLGLRVISPRLDLAALQSFLDQSDDMGPPAPLRIPALDAPLEVRDGRIQDKDWALEDFDLTLPALREGQPARLAVSARLVTGATAPESPPHLAAQLRAIPRTDGTSLQLDQITMDLAFDALPEWRPHLEGALVWNRAGSLHFNLTSRLLSWPESWPVLPLPAPPDAPVDIALAYAGDSALTGLVAFSLLRGEEGLRGTATLHDTLAWMGKPQISPLPPATAEITLPRMEHEGLRASGVRLHLAPDAPEETGH